VAQLAIAWVSRRSEVTAATVGARRPTQIEETAPAGGRDISDENLAAIEALLLKHTV
jgi:aryl-alcohol dehydrogenase-like predicted oxidoreductase